MHIMLNCKSHTQQLISALKQYIASFFVKKTVAITYIAYRYEYEKIYTENA